MITATPTPRKMSRTAASSGVFPLMLMPRDDRRDPKGLGSLDLGGGGIERRAIRTCQTAIATPPTAAAALITPAIRPTFMALKPIPR